MRIAFVLLLLGVAVAGGRREALAQDGAWSEIYNRPSNIVREIEMFDDAYGLALTGPGIMRTVDGGQTWTEPEGQPLIATGSIAFASRDVAWVATNSGGIWRTEDAGLSWALQPSNTTTHLNSIAAISEDEAWIAGEGEGFSDVPSFDAVPSALLHTRDGGAAWHSVSVGGFGTFEEVHASGDKLWLVATRCFPGDAISTQPDTGEQPCDDRSVLLRSDDGGDSWEELGTEPDVPARLQFVDEEHGFGAKDVFGENVYRSELYATTDGGETWEQRTNPADEFVPQFLFFDVEQGWSISGECDETGLNCATIILTTSDGGRTWRESHRIAQSYARGQTSAFAVTGTHVIVADGVTGIARAPLGGGAFVEADTPARAGINRPTFVSREVGFASNYPGLQKTIDGGLSWFDIVTPETLGETAITDTALWSLPYCGVVCQEYVYRSVDGGATWERKGLPPGIQVYAVQAVDADHAWAQGLNAMYRTTDGGASWQPINADLNTLQPLFVTADFGWSRNCAVPPCDGKFAVTTDGGMSLEERPLPNSSTDLGSFIDARTGWVSSYESNADGSVYRTRLWRTRDGARTWEDMGVSQVSINNMEFIDADRGWSIGYPPFDEQGQALGPQQIVATVDGGRTWTPEYTFEQTIFGGFGSFSSADDRLWLTSSINDNPWSNGRTVIFRREGVVRSEDVAPPSPPVGEIITPPDTGSGGYRS